MHFNRYFIIFCLALLCFSSCKKEEVKTTCDKNNFATDQSKINRKVLVIGIDGFRSDVLNMANAPFLFNMSQDANTYFTDKCEVEYYTSSGPNWTSLLTGLHWEKHKVIDNFFAEYDREKHPSFFEYIEQAAPSTNTASVCHWLPINSMIIVDQVDYNPIELYTDQDVYNIGLSMVNGQSSIPADVLFLHFDDLDHFGHAYGYHDTIPEYRQAVSTIDEYAEGLFDAVEDQRNLGEDWIVFIVSDHGGEGQEHSNKPNVPKVRETIFFAHHPDATFKSNYITSQADLAPSVLSFLGIQNDGFDCLVDGNSILE